MILKFNYLIKHFLNMTTSVVYREGALHRRAALEKALLHAVTPYEDFL